jgi:hypothetical protein
MAGGGLVRSVSYHSQEFRTYLGQRLHTCSYSGLSAFVAHTRYRGANQLLQRTFLKHPKTRGSVPIFAIGLSLYESVAGIEAEQIGNQVIRTQWLYVAPSHYPTYPPS